MLGLAAVQYMSNAQHTHQMCIMYTFGVVISIVHVCAGADLNLEM